MLRCNTFPCPSLPCIIAAHRSKQVDGILLVTLNQQFCIDTSGIYQLHTREQVVLRQRSVHGGRDSVIR
jgi:hypothetical protein